MLKTQICVTRPQCVNIFVHVKAYVVLGCIRDCLENSAAVEGKFCGFSYVLSCLNERLLNII